MSEELLSFLKKIEEDTGLKLKVYFSNLSSFSSQNEKPLEIKPTEEIVFDSKNNLTAFPFTFQGKKYYGALEGVGEENKVYCSLILKLIAKEEQKGFSLNKKDFLRAVLFGEVNFTQVDRYMKKFSLKDSSLSYT